MSDDKKNPDTKTPEPARQSKTDTFSSKLVKFHMNIVGGFKRGEIHKLPVDEADKYINSKIAVEIVDPENKLIPQE